MIPFGRFFVRVLGPASLIMLLVSSQVSLAQDIPKEWFGRWNLTIYDVDRAYPSWLELSQEQGKPGGRFVNGKEGSARPIPRIEFHDGVLEFSLPPQYEKQNVDLRFICRMDGRKMKGVTFNPAGDRISFEGVSAPELAQRHVTWGDRMTLLHENDLSNWRLRYMHAPSGWRIKDGMLKNTPPSVDLVTRQMFGDFKLHVEMRLAPQSNSGIYLRGRYELQVMNNPETIGLTSVGGVYGFIAPSEAAMNPPGEWNVLDVELVGRYVTVILNGKKVVDNKEIPGMTGGALDNAEAMSGPLMLQGDHREIEYRNIYIIPGR